MQLRFSEFYLVQLNCMRDSSSNYFDEFSTSRQSVKFRNRLKNHFTTTLLGIQTWQISIKVVKTQNCFSRGWIAFWTKHELEAIAHRVYMSKYQRKCFASFNSWPTAQKFEEIFAIPKMPVVWHTNRVHRVQYELFSQCTGWWGLCQGKEAAIQAQCIQLHLPELRQINKTFGFWLFRWHVAVHTVYLCRSERDNRWWDMAMGKQRRDTAELMN